MVTNVEAREVFEYFYSNQYPSINIVADQIGLSIDFINRWRIGDIQLSPMMLEQIVSYIQSKTIKFYEVNMMVQLQDNNEVVRNVFLKYLEDNLNPSLQKISEATNIPYQSLVGFKNGKKGLSQDNLIKVLAHVQKYSISA